MCAFRNICNEFQLTELNIHDICNVTLSFEESPIEQSFEIINEKKRKSGSSVRMTTNL